MTNRTITLKPWEVRAYLDGRLRQIRRPVKMPKSASPLEEFHHFDQFGTAIFTGGTCVYPPFGAPGTLLVGRETLRRDEEWLWRYATEGAVVELPAGDDRVPAMLTWAHHKESGHCQGNHMPRWASRITLRTVAVRVGRVQSVTEEDAVKCGSQTPVASLPPSCRVAATSERNVIARLWQHDYGTWEANPLVWIGDVTDERGSTHD
jgi:hypothetical protein